MNVKCKLCIASFGAYTAVSCSELPPTNPNIVIIFTDDQGYGDLGCYGATEISTPHIDKLAETGVRFTDFHVASSVSTPSRAALLTGCYPKRVGLTGVLFPTASWGVKPNKGLNPEEETIARLLKEQGYATAMAGKWHLGHHPEFSPLRHGFDSYLGIPYSNDMSVGELPLMLDGELHELNPDMALLTKRYTEFGVDFIEKCANEDRPFFLYVAHTMPHIPIAASDDFRGVSKGGLYGDVVEEIDWSVGEIVETLRRAGELDNTLIMFMSDNGPWLSYGDHGGSSGPLREGKFSIYEGGFRVPCVVSMPSIIAPNQVSDQLFNSIDILPTICELTGVRLPSKEIDGISVMDVFQGEVMPELEQRPFFYYDGNVLTGVRVGEWKYIISHSSWCNLVEGGHDGENGSYETLEHSEALYNLNDDIGESKNLIAQYPERAEMLRDLIIKFDKQMVETAREPGFVEL